MATGKIAPLSVLARHSLYLPGLPTSHVHNIVPMQVAKLLNYVNTDGQFSQITLLLLS